MVVAGLRNFDRSAQMPEPILETGRFGAFHVSNGIIANQEAAVSAPLAKHQLNLSRAV